MMDCGGETGEVMAMRKAGQYVSASVAFEITELKV